jgi:polyprenyl P-hydroxybenzoate/phenylacrylic acid decarboxylase-like protein
MPQPITLDMAVEVVAAFVSKNLLPRGEANCLNRLQEPTQTLPPGDALASSPRHWFARLSQTLSDNIQTRVSRTGPASQPVISSGSFRHDGMIVAPCSMKTLSAIRFGFADGLIARAADVTLKERRRLVLLTRETPLSDIHLENMLALSRMGAIIAPPAPAFYNNPRTIDDLIDQTVGRVLDLFGLETPELRRWNGMRGEGELPAHVERPRVVTTGSQS